MDFGLPDWESIVRTHGPMAFETAWRFWATLPTPKTPCKRHCWPPFDCTNDNRSATGVGSSAIWRRGGRSTSCGNAARPIRYRPSRPPLSGSRRNTSSLNRWRSNAELANRLRWAVAELPDREASVFSLHYFGEMANNDIAETLGISADAVGVALHKARKRLKELLDLQEVGRRRSRS